MAPALKNKQLKPYFSIIIPTLDEEKCLPRLLRNLKNQSYNNFEVIIVDAKSKDKTVHKAKKFKDKFGKLRLFKCDKQNVSYQRNLGAKKASADWLIFLDADSQIPANFLQEIKLKIQKLNFDVLSCWQEPDIKTTRNYLIALFSNIYIEVQKKSKKPFVIEAMLCFKKSSFTKLEGFDDTWVTAEGSEILKRAIDKKMTFKFIKNPKYKFSYRRLKKTNLLQLAKSAIMREFFRILNKQMESEKEKMLYPMRGGKTHQ